MNPSQQVAIVTGGGSGLGEATARALAARGAKVALFDISLDRAEKVAAEIGGIAVKCDVSSAESGEAAVAEVAARLGEPRILVNCAGIAIGQKTVGKDGPHALDLYRKVIEVKAADNATHTQGVEALGVSHTLTLGLQTRADIINGVGLYHTQDRVRYATVRSDDVRETGSGLFASAESRWTSKCRSTLGMRGDFYTFDVASNNIENSGNRAAAILSPKASFAYASSAP